MNVLKKVQVMVRHYQCLSWRPGTCRWRRRNGWHYAVLNIICKEWLYRARQQRLLLSQMFINKMQREIIGGIHPFKKYFEELEIGDQFITEKRMITSEDIDKFADLSGDHFYAHIKTTDFTGTMFEQQVAHGYFIMSAAAGLFVDSYEKNPVLLNYGIDELRFTKPVYPGAEIYISLPVKKKSRRIKNCRTTEGFSRMIFQGEL